MSNSKWVCFDCRSTYNREHQKCPTCGGDVQFIGKYFKPPKRSNDKEWEAIQILHEGGIHYDYGSGGFTSEMLDAYVHSTKQYSQRELLQVLHTASWYYKAYTLKWMAGERPRHPRSARQYLEKVEERKQDMFDIIQSVADKLGRGHPTVKGVLEDVAQLQHDNQ